MLLSKLGRVEKSTEAHTGAVLAARWCSDCTALVSGRSYCPLLPLLVLLNTPCMYVLECVMKFIYLAIKFVLYNGKYNGAF